MKKFKILKLMTAIVMTTILLISFTGCSAIQEAFDQAKRDLDNNGNEYDKYNAYIGILNETSGFWKVVDEYFEEFGTSSEIQFEEGFDGISLYSTSMKSKLEAAMKYLDEEPKYEEADAALRAMNESLSAYCDKLAEAKAYYGNKEFVDDNFVKAQILHTYIYDNADYMLEFLNAYIEGVNIMTEGQDEIQLENYKKNGSMVHYQALLALVKAQKMENYLYEKELTVENFLSINMDEFRPLYDEFTVAFNEYNDLVKGKTDAGKDEGIMTLSSYTSKLEDVKSASADLILQVQKGEEFADHEKRNPSMYGGTPEKLKESISSLLSSYNTWIV